MSRWESDDPPELRGVDDEPASGTPSSSYPAWVRLTALVIAVAVALFFVASYFV
ncbi:hypothetical protein GCM10009737_22980 [Nocardioides lentus]|uniref:Uncharacterized protein n=1 Tax=Nocardioides lentus TaxID=338077 RepID=A0ABN2PG41_9ACTN